MIGGSNLLKHKRNKNGFIGYTVFPCSVTHSVVHLGQPSDRVQGAVMSRLSVPESLVVVGHHVDNVQALAQGWEIVGLLQDGLVAGDGGRENQTLALVDAGQGLV